VDDARADDPSRRTSILRPEENGDALARVRVASLSRPAGPVVRCPLDSVVVDRSVTDNDRRHDLQDDGQHEHALAV